MKSAEWRAFKAGGNGNGGNIGVKKWHQGTTRSRPQEKARGTRGKKNRNAKRGKTQKGYKRQKRRD
jgi:hypothetical protein